MLTPDAMEALRWTSEVAGGIAAVVLCVMYAAAMTVLACLLGRRSGQEGANAWRAVVEDYEGPQEASKGIPPPPPKRQH